MVMRIIIIFKIMMIKNNSDNQYHIGSAAMPLLTYTVRMYASVVAYIYRLSVGFYYIIDQVCKSTYVNCHVNDIWHIAVLRNDVDFDGSYVGQPSTYKVPVLPLQRNRDTHSRLRRVAEVDMVDNSFTRFGTDSHAGITCIGVSGRILRVYENRSCLVKPFNDAYEPMKNIRMVDAAFKTRDNFGKIYIFIVNQA